MTKTIKFRRGSAADFTSANPTLAQGEPGFETDTGMLKIGDGTTAWNSLAYLSGGSGDVATDSIWDAKGDLAAGTGADTAAKLTVGTNDTVLKADSSQTTGLIWEAVAESEVTFTDITTNNSSTSKHGFLKKLDNNPAHFMDGTGAWSTPSGSGGVATDAIWDTAGDIAVATGADAASKLAIGASGKVPTSNGTTLAYAYPPGTVLDFQSATTNTTVTATTSATATTIVTGAGFTADGSTLVRVEFYAHAISYAADGTTTVVLYEGSTELGFLFDLQGVASSSTTVTGYTSGHGVAYLTPAAGTRTYSARAYRTVSNTTVFAGSGASGNSFPCFIRVTVA